MTSPPPLSAQGCPMLYGPDFAARPDEVYDQLRAAGPLGWAELAPEVHALVVTQYDAAVALVNDHDTYSKDSRAWAALNASAVPADSPVLPLMAYRPSALYADGEEHARLRSVLEACTDRIRTPGLHATTRRAAITLIDQFRASGRADLMSEFADTLPLLVFAELLGCPAQDVARMVRACQGIIGAGPDAGAAGAEFATILHELVLSKESEPGDDVTSWMLRDPAELNHAEIVNQLFLFVGAGVVPTAAWIGSSLALLLQDDEYAGSLASGTVTVRRALEKVLWVKSPMANFSAHYARSTAVLAGITVPAGVPVLVSHAAVNTDPARLEGLGFHNESHLAWSAGAHRCPAIDQATTIAQVGVETVMDVLWDAQLAVPPDQIRNRPGPFHQCPQALPVLFRRQTDARPGGAV